MPGSLLGFVGVLIVGAIVAMFLVLGILTLWNPALVVRLSHPDFKLGRKEVIQYRVSVGGMLHRVECGQRVGVGRVDAVASAAAGGRCLGDAQVLSERGVAGVDVG